MPFPPDPPILETQRLRLRPLAEGDVPAMTAALHDPAIATDAADIPYPITPQAAARWVETTTAMAVRGVGITYAILRRDDDTFVGEVGLDRVPAHRRAEIGYWIGKPFWGHGYATEATRRVIRLAFEELGINRVGANCYTRNVGSARVLQKSGLRYEGSARQYFYNPLLQQYEDIDFYALLRDEWLASPP